LDSAIALFVGLPDDASAINDLGQQADEGAQFEVIQGDLVSREDCASL
jgi:hypothetical protein